VDSLTALAAQQLEDFGIPIHPGEKVRYVIKNALSKDKDERVRPFPLVGPDDTYDVKKYLELLTKATEELLIHMGYDAKRLGEELKGLQGSRVQASEESNLPAYWQARLWGLSQIYGRSKAKS
jgi:DNA polymerase elongation subunit (family B)